MTSRSKKISKLLACNDEDMEKKIEFILKKSSRFHDEDISHKSNRSSKHCHEKESLKKIIIRRHECDRSECDRSQCCNSPDYPTACPIICNNNISPFPDYLGAIPYGNCCVESQCIVQIPQEKDFNIRMQRIDQSSKLPDPENLFYDTLSGPNVYYGVSQYEQYRGGINDNEYLAERRIAEQWLRDRFGINVISYTPASSGEYYSVVYESIGTIQPPIPIYYQAVVDTRPYECDNYGVVITEHRYIIVDTFIQYISYGYITFMKECGSPGCTYVYRFNSPLPISIMRNNQVSDNILSYTVQLSGGTMAEISSDGINFNGTYSFNFQNILSGTVISNQQLMKTQNVLLNKYDANVFFPSSPPCLLNKLRTLDVSINPTVNIVTH